MADHAPTGYRVRICPAGASRSLYLARGRLIARGTALTRYADEAAVFRTREAAEAACERWQKSWPEDAVKSVATWMPIATEMEGA